MKRITLSALLMTLFLLLSCGSGQLQAEKLAAESKISFFDSLIKIGQGFQEIFGFFGNAIGDAFGLTAVKSGDNKSKVGEHFKKIGDGLTTIKDKLKELSSKISETKNADGSTIEAVKGAIKGADDVFDKLIGALTNLVGVTKDNSPIGDTASAAAVAADANDVKTIIENVNSIIEEAGKSGIAIKPGDPGVAVPNANGLKVVVHNAAPDAGDGPKLADEVAKADPWAMIDKIKNVRTDNAEPAANNNNEAGALATGAATANAAGAKTNADLVAAVALKAMTKGGKLSATANEVVGVKAAAVTAVNKVLGVLDFIIRKTVASNLDKIREAVKGIQYSETTTESTEVSATIQPAATK
ncbi:variable large family protein [Borrelia turicatae]|uniref:variable large family protein n=1 Tax=Borrelia turicatae TaxID=142 RepID=UPI002ED65CAD